MFTWFNLQALHEGGDGTLPQEVLSGKSAEAEGMFLLHLRTPGLCQVPQEEHEDG